MEPITSLNETFATAIRGSRFEHLYAEVRRKENRLYSNTEVAGLPKISRTHVHFAEWQLRKRSASRLVRYLRRKQAPLSILDVGCGNGWLTNQMAQLKGSTVLGIDIHSSELSQATRVFGQRYNLHFAAAQMADLISPAFDIIVFAASLQYFSSIEFVIREARRLLNPGGEIHLLDTHFYRSEELTAAKRRTEQYYQSLDTPEMSAFYFHHGWESLRPLEHIVLFNPDTKVNGLFRQADVFPWMRIRP